MQHVFSVEEEDKNAWEAEDDQVDPSKEHVDGEELSNVVHGKEEGYGRQKAFGDNREDVGKVPSPASFCAVQNTPYFQVFWGAGGWGAQGGPDFLLIPWPWPENFT